MSTEHRRTFCNPFWSANFPDPFILKVRGHYYAYGTEGEMRPKPGSQVFPVLSSKDLIEWRFVSKAMSALEEPFFGYWAPEVTEYNDQFLLYYAVHTEEFVSSIRVAVANQPAGPFVDSGRDLTGHLIPWAIDPHVFRDQDGQWYLYMTIEMWHNPTGFTGVGNVVDRLVDPFTLQGNITQVTQPRHAWQLYEAKRASRGGVDWYTVEGPAVIRHRKQYYEMYSGGCYYRNNYAVSYATSTTPMGPGGMQDTSWRDPQGREDNVFLLQGVPGHAMSPGHNSFVRGPNNADIYIAYHILQPDMVERLPCLDRLFWHGDEPWTPAPTYTPQSVPALPRLRELFEGPALSSHWHQQAGQWRVANENVLQEDSNALDTTLQCQEPLGTSWLLEVHLYHVAGNGSYGVVLQGEGATFTRIAITAHAQLAVWSSTSPTAPVQMISLPENIVIQAWHQLIISRSGSLLTVQLDYLRPLEVVVEQIPRTFALFTGQCSAAFTAITLTDHFRDEFLSDGQSPALLDWHEEGTTSGCDGDTSADWRIKDGSLEQTNASLGEHILLKGSANEQFEFGATMALLQFAEEGQLAFGLVLWQSVEEKLFVLLTRRQLRWYLAIHNTPLTMNNVTADTIVDLPDTFDPTGWHTLRLVLAGEQLMVYMDGPQILTTTQSSLPLEIGLATRDASAAFTSVWQTGQSTL